jgi:hypothetical protein
LPVLERIPIGVVFIGRRLAGRLFRFARWSLFVRAFFAMRRLAPLFSLMASTRWFALCPFGALVELLRGRRRFGLPGAAEGSLEIEVGAEIVFVGPRRGRSALRAGRTSRAAIGSPRSLGFFSLGFFTLRCGPRRFAGWLSGGL